MYKVLIKFPRHVFGWLGKLQIFNSTDLHSILHFCWFQNKEVAVNIKKLPVGTVIFEDISIDKIKGKIIKTLKSNRRQSDPLGGRISCQTAKG